MFINVEIDSQDVVNDLVDTASYEDLVDFVKSLDLRVADMGFTEEVLKAIIKSSESDMKGSLEASEFKSYQKACREFLSFWDKID